MRKLYTIHQGGNQLLFRLFSILFFLLPTLFVSKAILSQPITERINVTSAKGNNINQLVIAKPSDVISGDVMIANLGYVSTNTMRNATSNGWTVIKGYTSGYLHGVILYKIAGNAEPSNYTFSNFRSNANVDYAVGSIVAFSGVDVTAGLKPDGSTGGPFDVTPSNINTGNSETVTATSITTVTANAGVLFLGQSYRQGNTARTWVDDSWNTTSPGSLNEIMDVEGHSRVSIGAAWGLKTSAGSTGNGTVKLSGTNTNNGGILIALKPLTISTSTSINIPTSSIVYGTASTSFTATVNPNPGGGTVQFIVDGIVNAGTATVDAGTGIATLTTFNPSTLNAGNHSVVATFNGTGAFSSSTSSGTTLTITQKPISITGIVANNKIYDGNTSATFTGITSSGIINGDVVTYTASGSFADKNVGINKPVNITGVTLGGAGSGNYSVSTFPATATANITPKQLTANSTIASKIYDATTTPGTITLGAITGLIGSETLTIIPSTPNYTGANVGNYPSSISYSIADGTNGGLASNYSMADLSAIGTILPRPITVTASDNTKAYDGTLNAASTPTLTSGSLAGTDAFSTLSEVYADKNVGIGKTLIPTATINDGNGGQNYTVTLVNNTNGEIIKQPLTVTAETNTKTYDGDVNASAIPSVTGTIYPGDTPNFIETYDNKNAGTNKTLTPSGTVDDGNGGNNYDITFVSVNSGIINKRAITVTAVTNTKTYDGNTSASAIPIITSGSVVAGETTNFSQVYDNKNAGSGKTLTPSGVVIDDNGGENYDITFIDVQSGIITPLVLTYVADPASRVYGTANPSLTGTVNGFISGENISNATTGTIDFNTTAIITSPVGSYAITGSGLTAINSNYTFVQDAANATAFTITKAGLNITPDNQVKCAGEAFTFSGTEFSLSGLVNSDAVTNVTINSSGASAGATPGTYSIVAENAVGTGLGNYDITYNTGILTVNARPTAIITSSNTAICNPGTSNITGTVTASGAWTLTLSDGKTASGNGNGTFSITVNPTTNTTYTISSLVDAVCSSVSSDLTGSTNITVNEPVIITAQPLASQKVCGATNTPVSFSVTATGTGITYQWYKGSTANPILGATSATYSIANPVSSDAGIYFVIVSGSSPCSPVQSGNSELIVNQAITISPISPLNQTICEGQSATFTVTATGTGLQYFWRLNGTTLSNEGRISGANTNSLTINPATTNDAGNYSLVINGDDNVCPQAFTSQDAILIVNKKSADPTSATASSPRICFGSSSILTLNGGGGGTGEVIRWYTGPNGTGTVVGTGNGITVNPIGTTTYYGRYENGIPCNFHSLDASVTVIVNPVSVGGTASLSNTSVCYNTSPLGDITLTGNTGSIQWQRSTTGTFNTPADNIVGAIGNNLSASQIGALTTTTYFRAVVKSGVCNVAYSNTITITINELPTVASTTPGSSCGTSAVTLSATASIGATIDWYSTPTGGTPVAINTVSFSPTISSTTSYYAEARNTTTGCISLVRTEVIAAYKSKPDALLSPGTIQTVCSGSPIADVTITNPNGTFGTAFNLSSDNPNVTGISSITGGNMISGTVTNNQNTQQVINYKITPVANGCAGEPVSLTVKVDPKPTMSVSSAPNTVCYNSPIVINFTNNNNVSGTVLSWTRTNPTGIQAGPSTSGNGNVSQTLVNTTGSNITVTYTLKATSPNGCFSEVTKDVILYAQLNSDNFKVGLTQLLCPGNDPTPISIISPVLGGSGNYSYQWQQSISSSGPWTNVGTGENYSPPRPSPTNYYRLIVTDINGCGQAISEQVQISRVGIDLGVTFNVSGNPGPLCSGSTFKHTITSSSIVGFFAGVEFTWSADNNFINSSTTNPYGERYRLIYFRGEATFTVTNTTNATVIKKLFVTPNLPLCDLPAEIMDITIRPVPTMIANVSSTPICSGVSLNAILKGNITDAATSFSWTSTVISGNATGNTNSNSGAVNAGNTFTLADNIINTGTSQAKVHYKVIPYSNGCAGTPVEFDVLVNPPITSGSISGPNSVCYGEIPTLGQTAATGNGTISYQWQSSTGGCTGTFSNISGATSSTYTPQTGITTSTTYRRIVSVTFDGVTCTAVTNCITVNVDPLLPVSVSIAASTPTVNCDGESMSFTATPTNGGPSPGYKWQINGNDVPGATGSTFTSNTLNNNDRVRVILTSNVAPCAIGTPATSNEITVTINPLNPVSTTIAATSPTTFCAGEPIGFTASVVNEGPNPTYQWYVNGYPILNANSLTFSSSDLSNGDKISFKVNSDITPCRRDNPATSNEIEVTVNPLIPVSVKIEANSATSICPGGTVSFKATPTNGGNSPGYQWKVNGINVGTNSDTYSSSTWANNDEVTCVLTSNIPTCSAGNPATSDPIIITVKPSAGAGTISGPTTNICVGGPTITYLIVGNNTTGIWSNVENNGVFSVDSDGRVTALKAGIAHLRYTVTDDCTSDFTELLLTVGEVPEKPTPISGQLHFCAGTSGVTYSVANVPGLTYHWNVPAGWTINGDGTNKISVINDNNTGGTVSVTTSTTSYNCGLSPASSVVVIVNPTGTWKGINADWNNGSNWCGPVPSISTNAYIPLTGMQSPYYFPEINTSGYVHNLSIASGATVTVQPGAGFTISGSISGPGLIDASQGTLEFNGSAAQSISSNMFKDTTIAKLKVSNASGLMVASSPDNKSIAITDEITFDPAKGKLNGNGNITLKSTYDKTASLGQLSVNNQVTGGFTVERFINSGTDINRNQHGKKWIFLATPTGYDGNGQTIRQSWMENGSTPPNYGIYLTGPEGTAGGWDAHSPSPAIKTYNMADYHANLWKRAPSANEKLYNPQGWMTFVRGDRTKSNVNDIANETTLRSKGALKTGDVSFTIPPSVTGFYPIGNPYASAIDMRKVPGINHFYVWDPNATGLPGDPSYGLGAYVTYVKDGSDFIAVGAVTGTNNYILSGQAFFLQPDETNNINITFKEEAKSKTSQNVTFFRTGSTAVSGTSLLWTNLYKSDKLEDGTLHIFGENYSNDVDRDDARKFLNSGINLSIKTGGKLLVVERRQPIAEEDTLLYNLTGTSSGKYRFEIKGNNLYNPQMEAWLEDGFTNKRTTLSLEERNIIEFEVTSAAASKAADRFRIVFKNPEAAPLPVTFVKVNAVRDGDRVNVDWKVAQEVNLNKYVVMKSTDGTNFTDLISVKATGAMNYLAFDNKPVDGYNYYRIRSVGLDGLESYSEIVKVFVGSREPRLRVFPNPVKEGIINLRLENYPAGKYLVRLLNPTGQLMLARQFTHGGGNYTERIPWDYKMAHGNYHLEVTHPDGSVKVIVVMY